MRSLAKNAYVRQVNAILLYFARGAVESHGSVAAFLAYEEASAIAVRMYVSDYISLRIGVDLSLDVEEDDFGPLHGVHVTDNESTIVRCDMREHVTYDDCAPFLANAVGYEDGAIASPWKTVVVARNADGTVCPKLAALFKRGPFEWKINLTIVELYMLALLDVASAASTTCTTENESATECLLSDVDSLA